MAELSDQVVKFLSEGTRTAVLSWVAKDGRPLSAPVWFLVENGELVFNTGKETAKGKALARDPRVVLCIHDDTPPFSFVQVQGVATISEQPDDVLDIATRTGGRYMGTERAEEFGRRNGVPGELVVRVKPTKVHAGFDVAD
ncbi:PPOX class F420-dependent oxidoreductase [Mycobacterium sp. LTG2003]